MKSDRRHELQTNELASLLTQGLERYRSHLPTVVAAAIAVLIAVVAVGFWRSSRSSSVANAWQEYYLAANAADMNQVIDRLKEITLKYPETEVYLWARLDLADAYCFEGKRKLDIDRENGTARLREAAAIYGEVARSTKARPEMIRRSALAEAKCLELMGEREKAIETYKKVARDFKDAHPEMAKEAADLASGLEQSEAADFYKWLSEYKAPASKASIPSPGESMFPPAEGSEGKSTGSEDPAGAAKDLNLEGKTPEAKTGEGESDTKKPNESKTADEQAASPEAKPDVKKANEKSDPPGTPEKENENPQ